MSKEIMGSPFKGTRLPEITCSLSSPPRKKRRILPALLEQWQGGIIIRVEDIT